MRKISNRTNKNDNEMMAVFQKTRNEHDASIETMREQLKQIFPCVQHLAIQWEKVIRKSAADFHQALRKTSYYPSEAYSNAAYPLSAGSLFVCVGMAWEGPHFTFEIPGRNQDRGVTYLSFRVSGSSSSKKKEIETKAHLKHWPRESYKGLKLFPLPASLLGTRPDEFGHEMGLLEEDMALILAFREYISDGRYWKNAEEKIICTMKQYLQNLANIKRY